MGPYTASEPVQLELWYVTHAHDDGSEISESTARTVAQLLIGDLDCPEATDGLLLTMAAAVRLGYALRSLDPPPWTSRVSEGR